MSLVQTDCTLFTRFFGRLFSALLAIALFHPGMAAAQEVKQIKLTEKQIQGFMAAHDGIDKLYDGPTADNSGASVQSQVEAVVKRNGFASLAEHETVSANIAIIMSGIDPLSKKFTEPPEQIRQEIATIKANKSIPESEKQEAVAQLAVALKNARPIQFKENIALVLKYFDQLQPLMQEQGPAD
jgi:hypothetical protein